MSRLITSRFQAVVQDVCHPLYFPVHAFYSGVTFRKFIEMCSQLSDSGTVMTAECCTLELRDTSCIEIDKMTVRYEELQDSRFDKLIYL